jgi:hypothetical protein
MDLCGIVRQIKTLDAMPLTAQARQNAAVAFQLIIDGLASQLFGAASERDRAASPGSERVPEEPDSCRDLGQDAREQERVREAF